MPRSWKLQDAKARFSELVKLTASEGPQLVTVHGVEAAVVLSAADYRRLEAARPGFVDYLLSGPTLDEETLEAIEDRARDTGRDIEL